MIRNLKALGLALVAVSAFAAVSASAASAANGRLTSDNGPVTLDATEIAGQPNALTAFKEEVKCPTTMTGHKWEVTPHELIPFGAETATLTPDYTQSKCKAGPEGLATHKATVTMEGCDYVLHLGETTAETDTYKTSFDVFCPTGKKIIVDVYFSESNENLQVCEITVGAQTGKLGAVITDETNGHLKIHGTYTGIHAEKHGLCGTETTTEAKFHANFTVAGTNNIGQSTNISLTHT